MAKTMKCSCGCTKAHTVSTKTTFDGYQAQLWSDGAITDRMGNGKRPAPKRMEARRIYFNDASILTWNELMMVK